MAVAVTAVSAVVGVAAPASADPIVTVDPATDLIDQQVVTVTASGFPEPPADNAIVVIQCDAAAVDGTGCDIDLALFTTTTAGSATTPYRVHRLLHTNAFGTVDCAASSGRCILIVASADLSQVGAVPLDFDPTDRPPSGSPPGWLDPTFGDGGTVTTAIVGGFADIAQQRDGKLVAVGDANDAEGRQRLVLVRYRSDGALDPSFGQDGIALIPQEGSTTGTPAALVIQPDGRLVVTGSFGLARFRRDGRLDRSFGTDGWAALPAPMLDAIDVALQRNGRLVIASATWSGTDEDFGLARFRRDGTLDPSFGNGGVVTTDFDGGQDLPSGIVIQADGRSVVAGSTAGGFTLVRYRRDGTLDGTFGSGGIVTSDLGAVARTLGIGLEGTLYVAGETDNAVGGDVVIARYRPEGILDTSFSEDGWTSVHVSTALRGEDEVTDLAVQADGRPVVATFSGQRPVDFALVRFRLDGAVDDSFGDDGIVTTTFNGADDRVIALVIQQDGKIVAAGGTVRPGPPMLAVARYYPELPPNDS